MKTWIARTGAVLALLLEIPIGMIFYSLLFEFEPPVHGEGPIFYLAIEIFNGAIIVGVMVALAVFSYLLFKRRNPLELL